jgi:hypothetical protein
MRCARRRIAMTRRRVARLIGPEWLIQLPAKRSARAVA